MDSSIGKGDINSEDYEFGTGKMVPTTKALDYKYGTLLGKVNGIIANRQGKPNGEAYSGQIAQDAGVQVRTPANEETNAIVTEQNNTLMEAADAIEEENMTPAEQGVASSMSWSTAFNTVKGTLDQIRQAGRLG